MSLMSVAMRRAADGGLDKIVATVAALAAGAAVFLMPGFILEQAVRVSGLPDMLPQLSPPLGLKSRAGLALLSAGSAFGSALLMLRILTFLTRQRPAAPAVAENAPRIRRRDRHPDAPARAPLSISRDLGEPATPPDPAPEPFEMQEPRVKRPASRRRAPLIEVLGDIHEEAPAAPEEPRRIKTGRDAEDWLSGATAPAVAQEPVPEEPVVEEVASAPAPEPKAEPEFAPATAEAQPQQPAWLAAQNDTGEAPAQESLSELLARFERALERKTAEQRAPAPASYGEEVVGEDGMDLRLRSALENLRRFAPSRG